MEKFLPSIVVTDSVFRRKSEQIEDAENLNELQEALSDVEKSFPDFLGELSYTDPDNHVEIQMEWLSANGNPAAKTMLEMALDHVPDPVFFDENGPLVMAASESSLLLNLDSVIFLSENDPAQKWRLEGNQPMIEFMEMVRFLRKQGYQYLLAHSGGPVLEGLPVFVYQERNRHAED